MLQEILSQLTLTQLLAQAISGLVLGLIIRFMLYIWNKKPPSEWLFLISVMLGSVVLFGTLGAVVGIDKRPKLKGRILMVNVGDMKYTSVLTPKAALQDAGFVELVAEISNTGAPSIATEYELEVTFTSGEKKTAQPIAIPSKGAKIPHKDSGTSEIIHRKDHLARKTIQPIPKGGAVQGLLLFMVEGATMQDLKAIGVSFRLGFKDLWGELYKAEIKNSGMRDVLFDWPGISDSKIEDEEGNEPEIMLPSPSPTVRKEASPPK